MESEGISHTEWPAYSSELNHIENLWDDFGHAIAACALFPVTLRELKTASVCSGRPPHTFLINVSFYCFSIILNIILLVYQIGRHLISYEN